jgi:catechol 2,3-dioxygenase-like lactoylglutathione lyase family enzyme
LLVDGRVIPAIPIGDLDRAKKFYGEKLGLEPVYVDLPGSQLYKCGLGSYLVIYQQSGGRPEQHVATFLVEEIENEVAALRQRGVRFEEYDLPVLKTVDGVATVGPIKGAWFKDPDGNVIGVVHLSTPI